MTIHVLSHFHKEKHVPLEDTELYQFALVGGNKWYVHFSAQKPAEKATIGLARVGSRAALGFAFAFLRRAWRSGEDADLCSELLQDSLDALRSLPEATLFDENSVSTVWLEVVERAAKFLRSVVEG